MGKKWMVLTMALAVLGSVAAAPAADLAHRWSFNGSLADSVAGKDVAIVEAGASNATLSDTQVTLAGGGRETSDYVDLPDGILSSLGDSVTIEVWATQLSIQNWSRIWDFGSSTTHNVFMSWTVGETLTNDRVEWVGGAGGTTTNDGTNAPYTLGTEFHIVFVFQPGSITWYSAPASAVDLGAAQGTAQTTSVLSGLQDTNCWLGRSQWGDNTANASYNEVRLWKGVLTAEELETLHDLGPDTINANVSSNPSPEHGAVDVLRDAMLSWMPGQDATAHDVYLGTSLADVEAASTGNAMGVLASQGQSETSFDAGRLEFGQTYYWRVDEVGGQTYKGDVWSFAVEPYSYPVANVTATASSATKDMGPEKTVNGSGLNDAGEHGTSSTDMWLSAKGAEQPAWIQYEFDRVEKLDKMMVWNSNQALETILGVGAKDVAVEYSTDGENWTALGDFEFAQAPASVAYTADTTVDFAGQPAKFVKLTISSNWGGILAQYGLAEVRFYYVPVVASSPEPAAGATDVNPQVNLAWRAGREAASHEVYISDDQQAVIDGTVAPAAVSTNEYETSLMLDTTYYWKVSEVNDAEAVTAWDSEVWSFTTGSFVPVDDFESYTDKEGGRIYEFWVDGYEDDTNGSLVGYGEAPFAEQTVIHGGKQSMPLAYDNSGSATTSEAKLTFEEPQDWTRHGITTLVVFFRGQSGNSKSSMYLKINDAKVAFDVAGATAIPVWKQWNIDLASVSGVKSVKSLTIGVEDSGAGAVFVDDIRLYGTAPEVVAPADPGTTGLIGWYKMEDNVQDSSGKNYHGTLTSGAGYDVGYDGKALGFNGTSTYVDLPIGPAINTLTNVTMATSVNFSGGTGSWQRIFDFGTGSTNYMFLSPRQATAGSIRFAIRTATVGEQIVDAPMGVPTDGWHHVAISIDSATMMMTLYLDGDPVGQAATTLLPKDLGDTNQNWLGRSQYTADAYFYGSLDEFRIYNRVLSAGEVKYLAGDR